MTTSVFTPTPEELQALEALARQLEAAEGSALELSVAGGPAVTAPPALLGVLRAALHEFGAGHAAIVMTGRRELSTQEAADMLGVSRPFLISNLLESGALPYRRVGSHRRIALADAEAYLQERENRRALLGELAREAQDMELY